LETEKNFADMAESEGIPEAFLFYAAEEAVLMRNNKLVIGRKRLQEYFDQQSSSGQEVHLTWKPDFVDVSSSGDLGYTYGNYRFSYTDSTGTVREDSGVFHTVWKRQKDGTWKFVWD
jgi:ketosteroid isomerase-like protein